MIMIIFASSMASPFFFFMLPSIFYDRLFILIYFFRFFLVMNHTVMYTRLSWTVIGLICVQIVVSIPGHIFNHSPHFASSFYSWTRAKAMFIVERCTSLAIWVYYIISIRVQRDEGKACLPRQILSPCIFLRFLISVNVFACSSINFGEKCEWRRFRNRDRASFRQRRDWVKKWIVHNVLLLYWWYCYICVYCTV